MKNDNTVWAWGQNYDGQLGNGSTTSSSTPVQAQGLSSVIAVAAGYESSYALKSDGTVWAWGNNANGQLGDGTTTNRLAPVQVFTGATALSAAIGATAMVVKSDGTVWGWGSNTNGQLGNGTTINSWKPVQVTGLSGVTAVAVDDHGLALKSDGTVWTWGNNQYGEMGNGTTSGAVLTAQLVPGLSNVSVVSAGNGFSMALKTDGTVWTWGRGSAGEMGNGTTNDSWVPIQVPGLGQVSDASAAGVTLMAVQGGSVYSWGSGSYGQLGNGTYGNNGVQASPVQIPNFSVGQAVEGSYDAFATKSDGSLWMWGQNGSGSPTPTQIAGFTPAPSSCGIPLLIQPAVLHSNGAELSWMLYNAAAGSFGGYQVHRSTTAGFIPSTSTLLTTISDPSTTDYVDTSAAPGGTFSYALVINGTKSNEVRVTLPAAGQASITLQDSNATYISSAGAGCTNFGADSQMLVGSDTTGADRGLIRFNLSQLIGSSGVTATLKLNHTQTSNNANTLHAYPATTAWSEGTGTAYAAACTGDGASWVETTGGQSWTSPGGDYDATSGSSQVSVAANESAQWKSFDVSTIVNSWATAQSANLGFLVRADTEPATAGNTITFASNETALRPQLTITYTDGSKSSPPFVAMSSPAPGSTVSGTSVALAAAAAALHVISQVQFLVDGASVGTAPRLPTR